MRTILVYVLFLSLCFGAKCGKSGSGGAAPGLDPQVAALLDCAGVGIDDFGALFSRFQALVNAAAGTGALPPGLLITGPIPNGVNWSLQIDIDGDGADETLSGSLTFANGIPQGGALAGESGTLTFSRTASPSLTGSFDLFFPADTRVRIDGVMNLAADCATTITVGSATGIGVFTLEASVPSAPAFIGPVVLDVVGPEALLDMRVDFSPGTLASFHAVTDGGQTILGTIDLTTGRIDITEIR